MSAKYRKYRRRFGLLCLLGPPAAVLLIGISIILHHPFDWSCSCLSDIGDSAGPESVVFNGTLIASAAFLALFSSAEGKAGLMKNFPGILGRLSLLAASAFLFGVGLFPTRAGDIHYYLSVSFFLCSTVALFLSAVSLLMSGSRRAGSASLLLGIASLSGCALFFAETGLGCAVIEMIPVLSLCGFIVATGILATGR